MAAIQLIWPCSITACALRFTPEYSFTDASVSDKYRTKMSSKRQNHVTAFLGNIKMNSIMTIIINEFFIIYKRYELILIT